LRIQSLPALDRNMRWLWERYAMAGLVPYVN
jgi:hypothetical protein